MRTRALPLFVVLLGVARMAPGQALFLDPARPALPDSLMHARGAVLVDVDGDADLDVLFRADRDQNEAGLGRARLWLNDGRAGFREAPLSTTDWNSPDLDAGDVDGDGDADFVMSDGVFGLRLYLNDGHGGFGDATSRLPFLTGSPATSRCVLADLDGDGDLDLFVGTTAESAVLANDGSGRFSVFARPGPTGLFVSAVEAVDIDRDSSVDLVLNTAQGLRVWTNDGAGHLVDTTAGRLPGAHFVAALAVADVTGDGAPDVIGDDLLFVNDGRGVFLGVPLAGRRDALVLRATDADGDGDCDLLYAGNERMYLLLNDGLGRFTDGSAGRLPAMLGSDGRFALADVVPGDLDGDGDVDLLHVGALREGRVVVLLNDGGGRFFAPDPLPLGRNDVTGVAAADFDGDGAVDLAVTRSVAPALLRNDGFGRFDEVTLLPVPARVGAVPDLVARDFDGDGDRDLFLLDSGATGHLLRNDGQGRFTPAAPGLLPHLDLIGNHVVAADLDGDHDDDLVITGSAVAPFNEIAILRNELPAGFTDVPLPPTRGVQAATAGDIDGDGDVDLVLSRWPSTDSLWLNVGGGLVDASDNLPAFASFGAIVFDADGDGHVDLLRLGFQVQLALGDGHGRFTAAPIGLPPTPPGFFGAGVALDCDLDGDLDIVLGDHGAATNHVPRLLLFLNDGHGRFSDHSEAMPRDEAWVNVLAVADFDADGDADLFAGLTGPARLLHNLKRQVWAPAPPRAGTAYEIRISTSPAALVEPRIAVPLVATARIRTPVPPFGVFGLDPLAHVALPPVLLMTPLGSTSLVMPRGVTGQRIYLQAAVWSPTRTAWLTNVFADVVQ